MEAPQAGRRETRLLLVTIAISVAMLLLLATFRFPEDTALQTGAAASAPLERLAARATYDELAGIMAELERRITPSVVVVPVITALGETAYLPAARIAPDRAVALLGPGERVADGPGGEPSIVVGRDVARNVVVLQVAARPGDVVVPRTGSPRPGPRYVAVADATSQGIVVRPVYVGRTDAFQDPRTSDSLLSIGAVQQTLPRGSAVFNLDAQFIGFALESTGLVTILPAQTLITVAETSTATGVAGDLGVDVQPLTPALTRALGTTTGVVVSYVDARGAAAEQVRPVDVILSVDDVPVNSVAAFQQVVASREPGSYVTLTISRNGKPVTPSVQVRAPWIAAARDESGGLVLHTLPGTGVEVRGAEAGSAAARADLRPGDVIIAVGDRPAPDADDLLQAFSKARSGESLLLRVRRGTQHRVVALEKP
jgi:membrane-associated protease RseP (regulator of RpoE activity)